MTTNLFVIANVKQLRTGGSFRILLPFIRTSWDVGVLNLAFFNSFHNRVEFGTILGGFRNFGEGGGFEPPQTRPPRYATGHSSVHLRGVTAGVGGGHELTGAVERPSNNSCVRALAASRSDRVLARTPAVGTVGRTRDMQPAVYRLYLPVK